MAQATSPAAAKAPLGIFYFFFFIGLAGFFIPDFAIIFDFFGGRPTFEPYVPLPIGMTLSFLRFVAFRNSRCFSLSVSF